MKSNLLIEEVGEDVAELTRFHWSAKLCLHH